MLEYLAYWMIYAFLGWCGEVAFAAVRKGVFVNRGFLNGPLCPIYGFGAVALDRAWLVLVGSVVGTTLLELVTGWVLERIFGQRWWDYSEQPYNYKGYISLQASLGWGLLCFLLLEHVHAPIAGLVAWVPERGLQVGLVVLYGLLAVDLVATVQSIAKLKRRVKEIGQLAGHLHELSDHLGERLAAGTIVLTGKLRESSDRLLVLDAAGRLDVAATRDRLEARLAERRRVPKGRVFGQGRLLKAYPKLRALLGERAGAGAEGAGDGKANGEPEGQPDGELDES